MNTGGTSAGEPNETPPQKTPPLDRAHGDGVDLSVNRRFRYMKCEKCGDWINKPNEDYYGNRENQTWCVVFYCDKCRWVSRPWSKNPEHHGQPDRRSRGFLDGDFREEIPLPPRPRRPRVFSDEWQTRRNVEARNREFHKREERKKGRMSEGMTIGIGLLVAFLLISGLGNCEGSDDCVDSYGQVRIDNC